MVQYNLYIIACADGSLYTGIATDVERRVAEHEHGDRGAKFLRGRAPLRVVFQAPAGSRSQAQQLEHRIKRLTRSDKQALIAGRLRLDTLTG
jgi:putative endonuclease